MKIFFSHSSRDKAVLELISQQLSDRFSAWIDERELVVGTLIDEAVRAAIWEGTACLIAFISKQALESGWVRKELEWAFGQESRRKGVFVLPVMLEDLPNELLPRQLQGRACLECFGQTKREIKSFVERLEDHLVGWLISRIQSLENDLLRVAPAMVATSVSLPPMSALEKLVRGGLSADPTDLDVVGYSAHEMIDMLAPLMKRALASGRRIRALLLAPGSPGHRLKSALEQGAHPMKLEEFRARNRDHIDETVRRLHALAETTRYQTTACGLELRIRLYNEFPIFRGVVAPGLGHFMGSYLVDSSQPGRILPHCCVGEDDLTPESMLGRRMLEGWFEYLWKHRSRPASVECVILDLYETLVSIPAERRQDTRAEMARRAGIDEVLFTQRWIETEKDSNTGSFPQTVDRVARILELGGKPADRDVAHRIATMEHECIGQHARALEGTHEALDSLRQRGYHLGLLSNCSPSVWYALRAAGILQYFDVLSLSYEMKVAKPATEAFLWTVRQLGSSPVRCIFVGDGKNDELGGAARAGLRPVRFGLREGAGGKSEGLCVASLGELVGLLDGMDGA